MKKKYKIAINGYYGHGSIGDEAILYSILSGIAKRLPNSRVTVLCRDSADLPRLDGIETVFKSRTNPFSIISALISADLYICGGGSLLQDSTSKRSLSYYCSLLQLARLCKCKIFLYANGIGPVNNLRKCQKALLLCDLISVRDSDSLEICRSLLCDRAVPILSADPVFAYPFSSRRTPLSAEKKGLSRPYFAVSLRRVKGNAQIDTEKLSEVISEISAEGLLPVFVSMQSSCDLEISKKLAKATGGTVVTPKNADELYCILEKAYFAMGMRLHFLLIAAIAGVPPIALSYDPKIEGCLKALGITDTAHAFDFSKEELIELIKNSRKSFSKSDTVVNCRRMEDLANRDADAVLSLLEIAAKEAENEEKFFADT